MSVDRKDIRSLRLTLGLRQADVASEIEVPIEKLRMWERGFEMPSNGAVKKLSNVFDVSHSELKEAQERHLSIATPGEGYATRRDDDAGRFQRSSQPAPRTLKVLDLFCGSGGFSHGFEQTGAFAVTAGIDILSDRVSTFAANHPTANVVLGDIRQYRIRDLGDEALDPDVVIGGPPCQGFSSIRPFRTYTEGDERNNLYEYFSLTVGTLRPRWFVLENVLGLLTHRKGKTLNELLESFRSSGYEVDWRVINAANFGLPQNRERLIVVGNRDGRQFEWPELTHEVDHRSMAGTDAKRLVPTPLFSGTLRPALTLMDAIHDLPEVAAGEEANEYRTDVIATEYERAMRGSEQRITLHRATAHGEKMLEIIRNAGTNRSALPDGLTTSGFSSCYSRLEPDRPSVTLTVNFVHPSSNKCIHPSQDRALTPREGARLQGFPDSFRFIGSRTQIVKQIGNAVPPLLGRVVAEALLDQW